MFGDERRRQINLGGATSTVSQASVLAQVQQERQRRHNEKRAHEASSVIQVRWRAHAAGSKTRSEMLRCFDNEPIGTIPSTRFLVLGGGEHQRLVAWTNAALNAGEGAIFQPFSGREAESWLVLLRQLTSMMLTQAIHSPLSTESNSFLQFINLLVAPRPNATPSTVSVAQAILQYLLKRNLYSSISLCIQNIPIESKSAPILGHLISLAVAPFRVFPQTSPSYSDALTQVCNRLMIIPLFPNRIGIAALTQFSSQVPFGAFHLVSVHDATHQLSNVSALHLLANLLTFLPPRYATANAAALGGKALETYIELLSNLVSQLPIGSMERSKSKHKEPKSWASDDDSDEGVMPELRLENPPPPALSPPDNKTALKLATLVSQAHVSSLLRVANKNTASWKQFVRLMINVSAKWPSKRDSILTTMAISGGNVVFKQLWRDSVRSSSLGKTADPLLMKRTGSAEEWPPFLLLAELYNQALLTMGDDEFFATNTPSSKAVAARNPFSTGEVILFSRQLLNVVFPLYWNEDPESVKSSFVPGLPVSWEAVRDRITKCLQAIHARDSRRPFTPPGHWLMTSQMDVGSFIDAVIAEEQKLDEDNDHRRQFTKRELAYLSPRLGILNNIPFAIPFESRVSIFRSFVRNDQQRMSDSFFRSDMYRKKVIIRRDHVSQDGFDHLNEIGAAWKGRLAITFVDQFGQEEAGIDGGGVFKEFLTSLSREVFDTNRGLWLATKQQELYPNSHSYAKEPHQLNWYRFIGRVLGKALYEGILVDVTFAGFFLAKWLGKQSFLDDLASLDADLYQGLLYLKNYTGNPEELSLDFTITEEDFGVTHTVNLKPNGGNIPVTRENRLEYIYLVSHYRLTRQIKKQTDAFFEGLSEIIDPKWLRMFNQQELKVLVGGAEEPIDLDDLRDNVVYGGLYDENHAVIRMFWRVVKSLDQEKRRQLLRFVTSCARPPLLGFKELYPKFAIRDAGIDTSRLPTASTCVNLLKLPLYQDEETMRRKLLHAITSGAGFDLS